METETSIANFTALPETREGHDLKNNLAEQENKIDPNKQIHPCSWSLCFCGSYFCLHILSQCLHVDGESRIQTIFLFICSSIDLLRDCGRTWSGTDVCSGCHRCWILVREETLPCDWWDEWTFLFEKVCKKIRDVRWYTLLRNLNMWIWFRDDCLRPGCDRLASSVQLAVDQQDHCWILPLGNF